MKRRTNRVIAMFMAMVMLVLTPFVMVEPAVAKKGSKGIYISEIKIGMGETAEEAKKELEAEGYTILKDDAGSLADLNVDAGSKSALKRGANEKIVYLGYKTTEDVKEAVTDLAVMNMNGGYSIEDYNALMNQQMDSQIKPFVDRFIATLEEYRENYHKPKSSLNHIRADYMRRMLNRLTDDDTGGKPVGDLLLNKTKYEMGDKEYGKLSEEEKKNHADILTLLMQANGKATITMETLLSKATDTAKNSWVDRFTATTLDDLAEQVQEEKNSLSSKADVMAELDRRYHDTALGLLKKWEAFRKNVADYEDMAEELEDNLEEVSEMVDKVKDIDLLEASDKEVDEYLDANEESNRQMLQMQVVSVCGYLKTVQYNDGTLLDFFSQAYEEVSGAKGIRQLYPIVDALSPGQIAGLDFLSFEDLFSIALADKNTYKDVTKDAENTDTASLYEGVDRGIYEKGGVALTSDTLRTKAAGLQETPNSYVPGTLQIVLWSATVGCVAATIAVNVVKQSMLTTIPKTVRGYASIWNDSSALRKASKKAFEGMQAASNNQNYGKADKLFDISDKLNSRANKIESAIKKGEDISVNVPSKFTQYLSVGLAVFTVIMTLTSTVMTILDVADFYDTEYVPIPNFMVDVADITAYNEKGKQIMVKNQTAYYKAVKCNRTAGDSKITKKNYEAMGDKNDLNGDIGTEWLALYAVKYENGTPILADSLVYQKEGKTVPEGYTTGIHEFGSKSACNMNNKHYLFRDNPPAIKVFFKTEKKTAAEILGTAGANPAAGTGSIFGAGTTVMSGGIGLIAGTLIGTLVIGRRKKR